METNNEIKYVCAVCGSPNIMTRYWHDANTGEVKYWTEEDECFCHQCDEITTWVEKKESLWDVIEASDFNEYDMFLNLVKDFYAPNDDDLAYKVEDDVNKCISGLMDYLDNKYKK